MNRPWLLGVVALTLPAPTMAQPSTLTSERFFQLFAVVRPKDHDEKWRQIPWRTSLWEARQQAAREGKPILLWEMDGHPLGCV